MRAPRSTWCGGPLPAPSLYQRAARQAPRPVSRPGEPPRSPRACRCPPAWARRRAPRRPAPGRARSPRGRPDPRDGAELAEERRPRRAPGSPGRPGRRGTAIGRPVARNAATRRRIDAGVRQRLVAERDHGGLRPGPERIDAGPERAWTGLPRTRGFTTIRTGSAGQGQATPPRRLRPGRPPSRPARRPAPARPRADEGAPVGHRERELLPPHAARRPGRQDDRRDHRAWPGSTKARTLPLGGGTRARSCRVPASTSRPWPARRRARAPAACRRA